MIRLFVLIFLFPLTDWLKNGKFTDVSHSSFKISWNSNNDNCSGLEWSNYKASCQGHDKRGNSLPFPLVRPVQHH